MFLLLEGTWMKQLWYDIEDTMVLCWSPLSPNPSWASAPGQGAVVCVFPKLPRVWEEGAVSERKSGGAVIRGRMRGALRRYYYCWPTTMFSLWLQRRQEFECVQYIRHCVSNCGCKKSLGHNVILYPELQAAISSLTILSVFDSI